jgi:hypothetical protein
MEKYLINKGWKKCPQCGSIVEKEAESAWFHSNRTATMPPPESISKGKIASTRRARQQPGQLFVLVPLLKN